MSQNPLNDLPTIKQAKALRRLSKKDTSIGPAADATHHHTAQALVRRGWARIYWRGDGRYDRYCEILPAGVEALERFEEDLCK